MLHATSTIGAKIYNQLFLKCALLVENADMFFPAYFRSGVYCENANFPSFERVNCEEEVISGDELENE